MCNILNNHRICKCSKEKKKNAKYRKSVDRKKSAKAGEGDWKFILSVREVS